jgi:hypothetical protein
LISGAGPLTIPLIFIYPRSFPFLFSTDCILCEILKAVFASKSQFFTARFKIKRDCRFRERCFPA